MSAVGLVAFSSGLPLAFSTGTLQAWMTDSGLDNKLIGLATLAGWAYTLKPLWAPALDRFALPVLDRRRGWILAMQLLLLLLCSGLALQNPAQNPYLVLGLVVLIASVSATQDIAIDAYRTVLLPANERGLGASFAVTGGRLALLLSGGVALILADQIGWQYTLLLLSWLFAPLALFTCFAPRAPEAFLPPRTFQESVVAPLREILQRPQIKIMLSIVLLYKFGDAIAQGMMSTFLLRDLGFSKTEVGSINKVFGLAATIVGALAGGALMLKLRLRTALLFFGMLQGLTNLGYVALASADKSLGILTAVVAAENLTAGMGTAAFLGFLTALTNQRFSAFQFALLSALFSLGRVIAGPVTVSLVPITGWPWFFALTAIMSLPALALIAGNASAFENLESPDKPTG